MGKHVVEVLQVALGVAQVMGETPGIKPTGIKLAAHQGALGLQGAERLEPTGGVFAEIDDLKEIRAQPIANVPWRIAGEERDGKAAVQEGLPDFAHIMNVFAIGAVFVFHLDHEDRAALGDLLRPEHTADFLQPGSSRGDVSRITGAQLDVRLFEQPPGQSPAIPLGAGVGAGPQNHP